MSALTGFLRRERLYILLLVFVLIMTAAMLAPGGSKAKAKAPKASFEETSSAQARQQQVVENVIRTNKDLALILGLTSLLFLLLIVLGIAVDIIVVAARIRGGQLIAGTRAPARVPWGAWDVCKVAILFLFFGYMMLLTEIFLSRVVPIVKNDNFRMILNTSILDCLAVFFILYFTVGQYGEKPAALGLTLRNFSKNVMYGVIGYVAIIPVLVAMLALIAFLAGLFKYVPEKQAVVELFLKEDKAPLLVYTSLFAAVAGPVIEELFFRAFMYSAARKYIGIFWAMLLSAGTFALLHAHAVGFFPILALGLLLAYLYEKTGSLVSSITVHMIHNLSMVMLVFIVKQIGVY